MYSVMLVDDEPSALHYMEKIIEKKCPEFFVAATANDGQEALDKIGDVQPDVLVFDICMPGIDGLEMARRIKELKLPVIMVVVSGHSEFDYAKQALRYGTVDYLLKPVMPKEAGNVFDRIQKKLDEKYFEERTKLLRQLYQDVEIPGEILEKYFGNQKFYVALARANGLRTRFSAMNAREIFSEMHEMMITYGRDERENLYICPEELLYKQGFEKMIMQQVKKEQFNNAYSTVIFSRKAYTCNEIRDIIRKLYKLLDNRIILGKSQHICVDVYVEQPVEITDEEKRLWKDFEYFAEKNDRKRLRGVTGSLLNCWHISEKPLLWVEQRVRNMYYLITQADKRMAVDYMDNEYAVEDAFANSWNMEQFTANVIEILFSEKELSNKQQEKMDTEEFVERICIYLKNNLEKDLNAQDIGREFGVSQTYLGKLFRKYRETSFNTYVTALRMETAKEMIEHDHDILIREVAERLGYKEQFYFSRVFRSYTGMCPTDFIELRKRETGG